MLPNVDDSGLDVGVDGVHGYVDQVAMEHPASHQTRHAHSTRKYWKHVLYHLPRIILPQENNTLFRMIL